MGKMSKFIRLLACFFAFAFIGSAYGAGYTCPTLKKYTSCSSGYYLSNCGANTGNWNGQTLSESTLTAGNSCIHGTNTAYTYAGGRVCPKANSVTITLNKNGGSGTVGGASGTTSGSLKCVPGAACSLPADGISRSGYDFLGWARSSSCASQSCLDYSAINVNSVSGIFSSNTTLYAVWAAQPKILRSTWVPNGLTGYYVYTYVTAPSGYSILRVQFPTWTTYNGQDDIQSNWPMNSAASGTAGSWTIKGSTYNYRYLVNFSDHDRVIPLSSGGATNGSYNTHIYAYASNGANFGSADIGAIYFVTMTLNKNGGSGTVSTNVSSYASTNPGAHYCPYNQPCSLPGYSSVYKAGYLSGGWNTSSGGTGTNYTSTGTFGSSMTLYMKWGNCGTGYYCPATSARVSCSSLGGGMFKTTSTANATSNSYCLATLAAGQYLTRQTASSASSCPSGYICPGGKFYYRVSSNIGRGNCQRGAYASNNKCVLCPAGQTTSSNIATSCVSCPSIFDEFQTSEGVGGYNASSFVSSTSTGYTISSAYGGLGTITGVNVTKKCAVSTCKPGYYFINTSDDVELCIDDNGPADSYYELCYGDSYDQTSAYWINACMPCAPGTYKAGTNAQEYCSLCSLGTTSFARAANCTACSNNANVASWTNTTPNYSSTYQFNRMSDRLLMVSNKCYVNTCQTGYNRVGTASSTAATSYSCTNAQYTITLKDNGGTGGMGSVKEVYAQKWTNNSGGTITTVTVPTRSGYVFNGYYTATSGGTQRINNAGALPGNTTFTGNTTLYAQWTAASCSKGSGVSSVSTSVSGNKVTCAVQCLNGFSQNGGTNTTASFNVTGAYGSASVATACKARTVTCNAGTYLPMNSLSCSACIAGRYCAGGTYTFNAALNSGVTGYCDASGWSAGGASNAACTTCTTASNCGACPTGYSYNSAAGKTVRTQCQIQCAAGRRVASSNATCTTPNNNGHAWGWYTAQHVVNAGSTSGVSTCSTGYTTPNTTTQADHDASADCKVISYTVTYNQNSGTGCTNSNYTVAAAKTLCTPSRTGYTFGGWFANSGLTGSAVSSIQAGSTGNKEYWAKWTANSFTVIYDLNGGTGTKPGNKACTYNAACALDAGTGTSYYRAGYVLKGWSTNKAATSGSFDGKNLAASGNVTVYAIWQGCGAGSAKAAGVAAATACSTCAAGTYNTTVGNASCSACPAGQYCTGGTNQTNCAAGTYRSSTGGKSANDCAACSGGLQYQDATGQTACKAVATGYYKSSNSAQAQCDAGYRNIAATSRNECVGTFSKTGSVLEPGLPPNCASQTLGTATAKTCNYTKKYSGTVVADCTPDNVTKPRTGLSAKEGYYVNGTTSCPACGGNGYFCTGGTAARQSVSAGYYSTGGTATTRTGQSQCTGATYCTGGEKYNCPGAETSWALGGGTGWTAVTQCYQTQTPANCASGQVKKNATSTTAWGAVTLVSQLKSNAGYYASTTATSCTICPTGSFCPANATAPTACSTLGGGLYTNSAQGSSANTACYVTTTAGKYIDANTDTAQTTCPNRYYCVSKTLYWPNAGSKEACPAATSDTARTTFPDYYYPYDSVTGKYITSGTLKRTSFNTQEWGSGWSAINYCHARYMFENDAGLFRANNVLYNPATGRYDGGSEPVYYWYRDGTDITPGYYLDTKINDTYCNDSTHYMMYTRAIVCKAGDYCPGFEIPKCSTGTYNSEMGRNKCPTGYASQAGAGPKTDCKISCGAGTRIVTADAASCTTPAGNWWVGAHTVGAGTTSTVNNCLNNYTIAGTAATDHDAATDCKISCGGGYYIAAANATSCSSVGAGYWTGASVVSQGSTGSRTACASGLTTIGYGAGADESGDCGRIMHFGDSKLYLRSTKKTTPSLNVKVGDKTYYGNMSTSTKGKLRIKKDATTYSVHDDSM